MLNSFKSSLQAVNRPVDKETILRGLKQCGIPTNPRFWTVFRNSGIIQEVTTRKYMFKDRGPIHYKDLARVKTQYQEYSKPKEKEVCDRLFVNVNEEYYIKKVKELGYVVFKPM